MEAARRDPGCFCIFRHPGGREIRVYDAVDNRLGFEDFFAKLALCYGRGGHGE